MANTIDAYCNSCKKFTYFVLDGDNWQCQSCSSYNTQADNCDSQEPYTSWSDY